MTPLIKEWVDERYKQDKNKGETLDMFTDIKSQLTSYLESHASLNMALKDMPELEMYVPQEYLDRIAEETVRVKKEKEESAVTALGIDVDALTRAAVAHRITSSGE